MPTALFLRAATCTALLLTPATAMAAAADPFAELTPLAAGELGQMRGGMMIGGIPVDFAVVVRTTAQGATQPAAGLQTTLAINGAGGIASSTTTPIGNLPLTPTGDGGVGVILPGAGTSIIQQISASQVRTLISNAASGLSIAHSTTIDVTLPGFLHASQGYSSRFAAARIGAEAALAGTRR